MPSFKKSAMVRSKTDVIDDFKKIDNTVRVIRDCSIYIFRNYVT